MDGLNLDLPEEQRAFHSLMEETMDRAAGSPTWPSYTARELFRKSHGVSSEEYLYQFLPFLGFRMTRWRDDSSGFGEFCEDLHTPPRYDAAVRDFFQEDGCTNFCTIRDPMTRLISAYKFQKRGDCTTVAFDEWVRANIPWKESLLLCHGIPQSEFVYGSPTDATRQWCDRRLRYENLVEEFNSFMEEFGKPLRMTHTSVFSTDDCSIEPQNISQQAKDLVYDYYRVDYDMFGYPRPS